MPKIIELKEEINNLIDSYVDEKQAIIRTIERLPSLEYDVLHKIYIQGKNLVTVAEELDYSVQGIKNIKRRALEDVLKFI